MKLAVFEGSPEEIQAIWNTMNQADTALPVGAAVVPPVTNNQVSSDKDVDDVATASIEFCRAVIGRRHLPDSQRKVLLALYAAYPGKMSAEEIADELDYTPAQMAGFWGAFYRRIAYTPDHEGDILKWTPSEESHLYDCALTENMKQAIELEGLVN